MGEDVGATGGIFGVSKGLMERYGPERVRDTPISEATFVGCGVGAAIAGMRPVVEIQIFDFVALTMDMLVNQAAKFRFMLGGKPSVPLVVRGPQGGGIRLAAQHSQSLEAWFTHVPGLVVAAPSTPYDAKGLLVAAIRDENPVVFLEQKLLYLGGNGPVPEELYAIPLGKADIKREGTDVTVVATSAMVPRALSAATVLERDGISVEVVDPRTLQPLDEETILAVRAQDQPPPHRARGLGARRLRRRGRGHGGGQGLRLSRRARRPPRRPTYADALQRPPRARGHPLPGPHRGGGPRVAVASPAAPLHPHLVMRGHACPDSFRVSAGMTTRGRVRTERAPLDESGMRRLINFMRDSLG